MCQTSRTFELTPAQEQRFRRAWFDGLTAREIGSRFGVGYTAVLRKADLLGLPRRSNKGIVTDPRVRQI